MINLYRFKKKGVPLHREKNQKTMKKIHQILCAAAVLATICACGSKNEFTINGTVDMPELEGQTVYIMNFYDSDNGPVDSTILTDGKFTFTGTVDEPWYAAIGCPGSPFTAFVVVEPGNITLSDNFTIGGTPLNDRLMASRESVDTRDLEEEMGHYYQLYFSTNDAAVRAEAERKYDSIEAIAKARELEANWALYNENKDNILAVLAMEHIVATGDFTYRELDSIVKDASPFVANSKTVQGTLNQLCAIDSTSAGHHYTDIQGVDGKLSDLIDGKLALVDFYASWCGPCRNEIKDNLVPLWKKYQKKGLVIVGLNVWERGDAAARKAAHEKVMKDLKITYPQLVDSTRTATSTYGVNGIPQIMLIAPDGTILARDLRGAAIEEAIINALGK